MKILYITTSFPLPDQGATIYTDLAEAIHKKGHELKVIVAQSGVRPGKRSIGMERGFFVIRVGVGHLYDASLLRKGLSTVILPLAIKYRLKKSIPKQSFNLILFEAPPVTTASVVKWASRYYAAKSLLMLKDIFPQNAVDIGLIKKNSLVFKLFKWRERTLYVTADVIGCMSEGNRTYLLDHNRTISHNKVCVFPNTKAISLVEFIDRTKTRNSYGIPHNAIVFIHGGNMGPPQYMKLHVEAVRHFRNDKRVFFVFVGRGTQKRQIVDIIKTENIRNAIVLDNLARQIYDELVNSADVGLITLDPRFTIPNYPSRVLSYMNARIPIIAATDSVTDFRNLAEACGLWCNSSNMEDYFRSIVRFASDANLRAVKGKAGHKLLMDQFLVQRSVDQIEDIVLNLSDYTAD